MKMYSLLKSIIVLLLLGSCSNITPSVKLNLSISSQQEITNMMTNGKAVVYYHSGDCSFCYGTLMAISKEFPNLSLISISASENKKLVDYYLEQINFKGISLIDSTLLFLNRNQKQLSTQNLFLIDQHFNVLAGGLNFNKSIKEKIKRALRDY